MTLYCYNIIYDEDTELFIKHGTELTAGEITDADANGMTEHTCGFYVNVDVTVNDELNVAGDVGLSTANTNLSTELSDATTSAAAPLTINSIVGDIIDMKISLTIKIPNPVIKAVWNKTLNPKKTSVLTR